MPLYKLRFDLNRPGVTRIDEREFVAANDVAAAIHANTILDKHPNNENPKLYKTGTNVSL